MKNISTALRRVKDRNAALTSHEQLPVQDFTVCDVLAAQMRSDGNIANQELRRVLRNEVLVRISSVFLTAHSLFVRGC